MLTNFLFVCAHALESLHIATRSGDKDVPKSVKHVQSFCFAHKTSNILFVVVVLYIFHLLFTLLCNRESNCMYSCKSFVRKIRQTFYSPFAHLP